MHYFSDLFDKVDFGRCTWSSAARILF